MTKVMLVLGGFAFMLQTAPYRTMARTSGYRWQGVDRLGRKPAQQFLGPGADEITLEGEIMPAFGGGASQLDTLRAYGADRGGVGALITAISAISAVARLL